MRRRYSFKDLEAAGRGCRNTVKAKIRKGTHPPPDGVDETGHPFWYDETMERHNKTLSGEYMPVTPKHLKAKAACDDS